MTGFLGTTVDLMPAFWILFVLLLLIIVAVLVMLQVSQRKSVDASYAALCEVQQELHESLDRRARKPAYKRHVHKVHKGYRDPPRARPGTAQSKITQQSQVELVVS